MHIRGIHSFAEFVLRVNKGEEGCPRAAVRRWEQRMPPSPVLKKVSLGQKPLPAEGTGAQRQPSSGGTDGCLPEGRETVWEQVSTWALFPRGTGQSRQSSGVSARWQTDQESAVLPKAKHSHHFLPVLASSPDTLGDLVTRAPSVVRLLHRLQHPHTCRMEPAPLAESMVTGGSAPLTPPPLQG